MAGVLRFALRQVASVEYLEIPVAALVGWLFFREFPLQRPGLAGITSDPRRQACSKIIRLPRERGLSRAQGPDEAGLKARRGRMRRFQPVGREHNRPGHRLNVPDPAPPAEVQPRDGPFGPSGAPSTEPLGRARPGRIRQVEPEACGKVNHDRREPAHEAKHQPEGRRRAPGKAREWSMRRARTQRQNRGARCSLEGLLEIGFVLFVDAAPTPCLGDAPAGEPYEMVL